jgi:DNA-binding HxlR family transcriptional regulator
MAKRAYGQYCGFVRALELVGERWALLIIRDLLVAPRRYTDLRQGFPRIPTNILSARLKELEQAGIIQRRVLPRPSGAVVYELTNYGLELEDVIINLGRWGARSLGAPAPGDIVTPSSLVMAMRTTFCPTAAKDDDVTYELRIGPAVINIRIEKGRLRVAEGPLAGADLTIETGPQLKSIMTGELTPDDAIKTGTVRLTGDQRLLARFAETFRIE